MTTADVSAAFRRRVSSARRMTVTEILGLVISVILVLLIVVPLARLVYQLVIGAGGPAVIFNEVLSQPDLPVMFLDTAIVVGASTFLSVAIACVFAWLNTRTNASIGALGRALPILPLLVLPVAGAVGWVAILSPASGYANGMLRSLFSIASPSGPVNIYSWGGLIAIYTLYLVPQAYVIIAPAIANIDRGYEEAALISGASSLRTFLRISIPAVRPALISAWLLVLVFAIGLYSVPAILAPRAGIDILSVRMVELLTTSYPPKTDVAVGLSLVVVVVVLIAWLTQRRVVRNPKYAALPKNTASVGTRISIPVVWRWVFRVLMIAYVLVAAVLPFVGLVILSLQPYWVANIDVSKLTFNNYTQIVFDNALTKSALQFSLSIGIIGAVICIVSTALFALLGAIGRGWVPRWLGVVSGVLKIPATLSHIVIAVGLVVALAGPPFRLGGTLALLLIAYVTIYGAQASIASDAAVAQIGKDKLEASEISGARMGRTMRSIALPLIAPSLVSGAIVVFVFILGDLSATRILASSNTPAVGFVLLDLFENGTFPQLAALATVVSILSGIVVLVASLITRRRSQEARAR